MNGSIVSLAANRLPDATAFSPRPGTHTVSEEWPRPSHNSSQSSPTSTQNRQPFFDRHHHGLEASVKIVGQSSHRCTLVWCGLTVIGPSGISCAARADERYARAPHLVSPTLSPGTRSRVESRLASAAPIRSSRTGLCCRTAQALSAPNGACPLLRRSRDREPRGPTIKAAAVAEDHGCAAAQPYLQLNGHGLGWPSMTRGLARYSSKRNSTAPRFASWRCRCTRYRS